MRRCRSPRRVPTGCHHAHARPRRWQTSHPARGCDRCYARNAGSARRRAAAEPSLFFRHPIRRHPGTVDPHRSAASVTPSPRHSDCATTGSMKFLTNIIELCLRAPRRPEDTARHPHRQPDHPDQTGMAGRRVGVRGTDEQSRRRQVGDRTAYLPRTRGARPHQTRIHLTRTNRRLGRRTVHAPTTPVQLGVPHPEPSVSVCSGWPGATDLASDPKAQSAIPVSANSLGVAGKYPAPRRARHRQRSPPCPRQIRIAIGTVGMTGVPGYELRRSPSGLTATRHPVDGLTGRNSTPVKPMRCSESMYLRTSTAANGSGGVSPSAPCP